MMLRRDAFARSAADYARARGDATALRRHADKIK